MTKIEYQLHICILLQQLAQKQETIWEKERELQTLMITADEWKTICLCKQDFLHAKAITEEVNQIVVTRIEKELFL